MLDQSVELKKLIDNTPAGGTVHLDHTVERTVYVENRHLVYTGTLRTLTDNGGITDPKKARTRSIFELIGGDHTFVDVRFKGPARGGKGPKVVIDGKRQTAYEGQSFIAARATKSLHLCGGHIDSPWGDALHLAWTRINGRRELCTNTTLFNVDITNPGRCGVVANDFRGLEWRGGTVTDTAGSMFDIEPGTGTNNGDVRIKGVTRRGTGAFFAHLHGGSPLENVYIEDNVSIGSPASIECVGLNPLKAVAARTLYRAFKNINVIGNVWDQKEDGGRIARFMHVHGLRYIHNEGPIRKLGGVPLPPEIVSCTDVTATPNRITRV